MNYLAQGLQQGWQSGTEAAQRKKDREERERLEKARRELELDVLARRTAAERELQNERLVHDAKKQFSEQGWRSGEGDKERGWRGGESEKERQIRLDLQRSQQGFQSGEGDKDRGFRSTESEKERGHRSGESQLDRDARQRALDRELSLREKMHGDELPLRGAQIGIQSRHQEWLESPDNPYNTIRDAQAEKLRSDYGSVPPTGGQFTGKQLSASDQQALEWARANPTDPRAKQILLRLGLNK